MPHADSLQLPEGIDTKAKLYEHILTTLEALLVDDSNPFSRNYVSALSNAASLLFGIFENAEQFWGRTEGNRVNWTGFYLLPTVLPLPHPSLSTMMANTTIATNGNGNTTRNDSVLFLGPFHGRPACQSIGLKRKTPGVCATAFLKRETQLVPDVEAFPGHIACDGQTKSEIVLPLWGRFGDERRVIGVLDLDCEKLDGFDEQDKEGLERVVQLLERTVAWP